MAAVEVSVDQIAHDETVPSGCLLNKKCGSAVAGSCALLLAIREAAEYTDPQLEVVATILRSSPGDIARADILPQLSPAASAAAKATKFAQITATLLDIQGLQDVVSKTGERGSRRYQVDGEALVRACANVELSSETSVALNFPEPRPAGELEEAVDTGDAEAAERVATGLQYWIMGRLDPFDFDQLIQNADLCSVAQLDAALEQAKRLAITNESYARSAVAVERFAILSALRNAEGKPSIGQQARDRIITEHNDTAIGVTASTEPEEGERPPMPDTTSKPRATVDATGWQDFANCLGVDPDLFFPERGASTREAKEVCKGCVVREDCLEYALANGEKFGIWGGLSERERRRIRRQRSIARRTALEAESTSDSEV